ncbi:hypothetical protein KSF78_0000507 [Schistosoma japonicum]|nr:hypothetical protein KSF78_0000507 [Schistosoma japonicum]
MRQIAVNMVPIIKEELCSLPQFSNAFTSQTSRRYIFYR